MTLPERGTPEGAAAGHRIHKRIMDTVSNIAVRRKDLPHRVHVLIHDDVIDERFWTIVNVQYIGESGMANITRTTIGMVEPGVPLTEIADWLVEHDPNTPLVCDRTVAEELAERTTTWLDKDHYRLEARPGGVLEVYTPFEADQMPEEQLPPGVTSVQFYRK